MSENFDYDLLCVDQKKPDQNETYQTVQLHILSSSKSTRGVRRPHVARSPSETIITRFFLGNQYHVVHLVHLQTGMQTIRLDYDWIRSSSGTAA